MIGLTIRLAWIVLEVVVVGIDVRAWNQDRRARASRRAALREFRVPAPRAGRPIRDPWDVAPVSPTTAGDHRAAEPEVQVQVRVDVETSAGGDQDAEAVERGRE